jgi:hypothetical protein
MDAELDQVSQHLEEALRSLVARQDEGATVHLEQASAILEGLLLQLTVTPALPLLLESEQQPLALAAAA